MPIITMNFTVILYRKEDEKQHFRCKIHGCRLLETAKGYYCPISCSPTYAAMRIVDTYNPSPISQGISK